MAKLFFYYGTMNAAKSAQLVMVAYNYNERGQKVMVFKPEIDNRISENSIKSRCGVCWNNVSLFNKNTNFCTAIKNDVGCVLIDEAQFLTESQVKSLANIVDFSEVPVLCYGLRTNFKGELFEGSKWLMAYSDNIIEIKTICFCGKKATFVARVHDGKKVEHGEEVQIGGNESYVSLCRKHWELGKIS